MPEAVPCTEVAPHLSLLFMPVLVLQVVIAMLVGHLEIRLLPSVGGWQGLLQRRMYHTTLQIEGGLPLLLRPRATADLAG